MPDRVHPLTEEQKNYVPGYDWIQGRYGPPPGVERSVKEQYDRMNDRRFMEALLKHSEPEQMSLMIAEDDRRRTYMCEWKHLDHLPCAALAKEGLFYTGQSDRVQCAFCEEAFESWVIGGDTPSVRHKRCSPRCEMVTKGPPYRNIQSDPPTPDPPPPPPPPPDITKYDTYAVVESLGKSVDTLRKVFERNQNKDFINVQVLLDAVLAYEKEDTAKEEQVQRRERRNRPRSTTTNSEDKAAKRESETRPPLAKCLKSEE